MLRFFIIGSVGYPLLELLYRRRTHPAMALAGGLSLCALRAIHLRSSKRPLWQAAIGGGLCITGIEYVIGRALNRRHQIWDYRAMPCQYRGQVCLPFFAVWCGLSAAALGVMRRLEPNGSITLSPGYQRYGRWPCRPRRG